MVAAWHSARRPAAKCAILIAVLFFVCCIARSDAQVEIATHRSFDTSRIVGSWSTHGSSLIARGVLRDDRAAAPIASAQSLLTTPKTDGAVSSPERVAPLRIDTEIHARRVYESAQPVVRFSPHLAPGQRRTLHVGTRGVAWVTERITRWDDVLVSRQTISRQTVRTAKPEIVLVGSPKTLAQLRSAMPKHAVAAALTMIATAYTADTATAYPTGYTATGILAHEGVVAVDPRVIPLGTTVFIPGYGIGIAADTGGAIVGNRIDLCMDRYGDAITFGRQTVQVYILMRR